MKNIKVNGCWCSPYDSRDQIVPLNPNLMRTKGLPIRYEIKADWPAISQQGKYSTCAPHVLTEIREYLHWQQTKRWKDYSRLELYYKARKYRTEKDREQSGSAAQDDRQEMYDQGCYMRDCLKIMKKHGMLIEKIWPYKPESILHSCHSNATPKEDSRIQGYKRITRVNSLLHTIWNHGPVASGLFITERFVHAGKDDVLNKPETTEQTLGGHAVMVVGFDRTDRTVLIRNSWGHEWGDMGYKKISWDWFSGQKPNAFESWMVY